MAHVTEFGLFSISAFHGGATLVIAVTYVGLDEWHQSFVPLREARGRDVAIDAFGAVLAQALVWLYAKLRSNFAVQLEHLADAEEK